MTLHVALVVVEYELSSMNWLGYWLKCGPVLVLITLHVNL